MTSKTPTGNREEIACMEGYDSKHVKFKMQEKQFTVSYHLHALHETATFLRQASQCIGHVHTYSDSTIFYTSK